MLTYNITRKENILFSLKQRKKIPKKKPYSADGVRRPGKFSVFKGKDMLSKQQERDTFLPAQRTKTLKEKITVTRFFRHRPVHRPPETGSVGKDCSGGDSRQ